MCHNFSDSKLFIIGQWKKIAIDYEMDKVFYNVQEHCRSIPFLFVAAQDKAPFFYFSI